IEFAEHREYTPGVDPRHIDWRVLGRRDKLYVKQYEEETSLRCHLLLDKSASMGYKSDGVPLTKLQYASYLAASLDYLTAGQHEVIVFQILDPAEVTFPFDDITRIEDLENRREVTSDPRAFRRAYLDELARFLETIQNGCRTGRIDYVVAQTDQRFDLFLGTYL